MKTRRIYCSCHLPDGSTTEVSDTKLCVDNAPALPVSRTLRQVAYSWDIGQWRRCNAICGAGIRRRPVVCRRSDNRVVPERNCEVNKPPVVQSCNQLCNWTTGDWSDCSITCGCGRQTRTVTCVQILEGGRQQTVANSHCTNDILLRILGMPAGTKECERFCYEWVAQPWGLCSSHCGLGIEERDVACIRAGCDGRTRVEDSDCRSVIGFIQKPNTTRECDPPCEYSLGSWSPCSHTCGPGVQVRVVNCVKILESGGRALRPMRDCSSDTTIALPRPPPAQEICNRGICTGKPGLSYCTQSTCYAFLFSLQFLQEFVIHQDPRYRYHFLIRMYRISFVKTGRLLKEIKYLSTALRYKPLRRLSCGMSFLTSLGCNLGKKMVESEL